MKAQNHIMFGVMQFEYTSPVVTIPPTIHPAAIKQAAKEAGLPVHVMKKLIKELESAGVVS